MLGEEGEVLSSPRGRLRGGSGLRAGFKPYTKTPATRDSVIPFTTFQEHLNCEAASVRREHNDHDANIITWEIASLGIECVKKVRKKTDIMACYETCNDGGRSQRCAFKVTGSRSW